MCFGVFSTSWNWFNQAVHKTLYTIYIYSYTNYIPLNPLLTELNFIILGNCRTFGCVHISSILSLMTIIIILIIRRHSLFSIAYISSSPLNCRGASELFRYIFLRINVAPGKMTNVKSHGADIAATVKPKNIFRWARLNGFIGATVFDVCVCAKWHGNDAIGGEATHGTHTHTHYGRNQLTDRTESKY